MQAVFFAYDFLREEVFLGAVDDSSCSVVDTPPWADLDWGSESQFSYWGLGEGYSLKNIDVMAYQVS